MCRLHITITAHTLYRSVELPPDAMQSSIVSTARRLNFQLPELYLFNSSCLFLSFPQQRYWPAAGAVLTMNMHLLSPSIQHLLLRAILWYLYLCNNCCSPLSIPASAANSFYSFGGRSSKANSRSCDQVHELTALTSSTTTTNVITIDSPNYPFTQYPPLSSCRHSIKAPPGYAITVQCNINLPAVGAVATSSSSSTSSSSQSSSATEAVFTNSNRCQTDFLYISAPATDQSNDGYFEYFCGRGYVSRTSVFNTLTLAYASKSAAVAGYFSCSVFAKRSNCDCGWNPRTRWPGGSGRISGGQEATPNEYAAMVALVDKLTSRVFCGGSISECGKCKKL